jgi:hypothetical protein
VWGGRNGREGPTGTRPAPATPAPVAAVPVPEPGALRPPPSGVTGRAPAGPGLELPLPELDSLPADVLDSMLQSLDEPLTRVGAYDLPADDSGDQELARALADLEG